MKTLWFMLFGVLLVLGGLAYADEEATKPEDAGQEAVEETSEGAVLSTEMSGVDSLDVLPKEMITRSGEGTRRVKLETTVFRREEPVRYASEGRRDPFRALIVNEKKEGEIKTGQHRVFQP